MQRYINNFTDRNGNAIPQAVVSVYREDGTLAALYSDDGVTAQANPMRTDANGEFSFYAADGVYSITLAKNGHTTRTIRDVRLFDWGSYASPLAAAEAAAAEAALSASAAAALTNVTSTSAASFATVSAVPSGALRLTGTPDYDINLITSADGIVKIDSPLGISTKASTIGPDYGAPALTIASGTYTSATGAISLTLSAAHSIVEGDSVRLTAITGTGVSPKLLGYYVAKAGTAGTAVVLTGATGLGDGTFSGGTVLASQIGGMAYRKPTESMLANFWNLRMGGYNFERDDASWIMQVLPNGVNIGSPNSLTATPKNTFEVGGGSAGNPNNFFGNAVIGRDWARVQVAPDSSLMVQQAVFIGGVSAPYRSSTIASANYDPATGDVTVTLAADVGIGPYQNFSISGAAGTGDFARLNGAQVSASGSSGTALVFRIATGLTMTISGMTVTGAPAVSLYTAGASYLNRVGSGGSAFAPTMPLEARISTGGAPATSGTAQTTGIARLKADSSGAVADFGVNGTNGLWIVATNSSNLSSRFPIVLGDGGNVQVGTSASSPACTLTVAGSFAKSSPVTIVIATRTVAVTDAHLIANFAGTVTLTLPAASSFPGREITVRTIQNQSVVSASANVVPAIGGAAGTAILGATAGKWAVLVSDGTNWQIQMAN
jgi:hypothetical protein